MRYHKDFFEAASSGWLDIAERIRNGSLNRADAFEAFRELREAGNMPGVGPAYYTKLIYFLSRASATSRKPQGFILDQWTARSINLLSAEPIIHLNIAMSPSKLAQASKYTCTVSDANSSARYERFCCFFDALAKETGESVDNVDHALQRKGEWREHVKENIFT